MAGISPNRWSSRLLIIFWGFTTLIFVQSYTANLTSTVIYQMQQNQQLPTTVANLISSSMTLGTVANSLILQFMKSQQDSQSKMITQMMTLNARSINSGMQSILNAYNTQFPPYGFIYFQAVNDYLASTTCNLGTNNAPQFISQPVFNSIPLYFAIPQTSFPKINLTDLNLFISNNTMAIANIYSR
jgi:hypothetical protein